MKIIKLFLLFNYHILSFHFHYYFITFLYPILSCHYLFKDHPFHSQLERICGVLFEFQELRGYLRGRELLDNRIDQLLRIHNARSPHNEVRPRRRIHIGQCSQRRYFRVAHAAHKEDEGDRRPHPCVGRLLSDLKGRPTGEHLEGLLDALPAAGARGGLRDAAAEGSVAAKDVVDVAGVVVHEVEVEGEEV